MKLKKSSIIILILLGLLAIPLVVFDSLGLFQLEVDMSGIIIFALSLLSIIFSLWFAYLLALKQIYANRYSKEVLKEYVYTGNRWLIYYYFILLVTGFVLLIFCRYVFYVSIYYIVNCILCLILCGYNISKKIGENEVRNLVTTNVDSIIAALDKMDKDSDIDNCIKKIRRLYDDAYNNLDQSTCTIIINSCYKFCNQYIKQRNVAIIEKKEKYVSLIENFIKCYCSLIKTDVSDFATNLNRQIILCIYKLADICLDCDTKQMLEQLINVFAYVLDKDKQLMDLFFEDVYGYLQRLEIKAASDDKQELFDKILKESESIYLLTKFKYNKTDLAVFLKHYVGSIESIKENTKYKVQVFSELKNAILRDIDLVNCRTIFLVLSLFLHDKNFINEDYYEDYLTTITKIIDKSLYCDDLYTYIMFVVNELKELNDDKRADELQYYLVSKALRNCDDVPVFIVPDFSHMVEENISDLETNEKVKNNLVELLFYVIDRNNVKWLNILLSQVQEILQRTAKQDKDIQRMWIKVLNTSLVESASAHHNNLKDISLRFYKKTLQAMDDKKNISKDLAIRLIHDLSYLCEFRYRENVDFNCEIIEFLDSLLGDEHIYRFVDQIEVKTAIYSTLYNICIDAIEKNQDLVIKRISNFIGWRIKEAIEKGHTDIANELIDYAVNIFNLAKANKISQQTIVFVGTLFIIIGAYSNTKPKYISYRKRIINSLKKTEDKDYLLISKQLRCAETSVWKSLLGDNPKLNIDAFWNDFNK